MSHFVSPRRMQSSARLLNEGTSYCSENLSGARYVGLPVKTSHRPYPRVGRSTLWTVGEFGHSRMRRIVCFVIRDSLLTRTAQTLSYPCIDTSRMLGT